MNCMCHQPFVSIIVPVYNGEKYIKECLYSLSGQSYKAIEIIVVDDGSTDNSINIAKSLNLNNITFVIGEHRNIPSARNKGINNSKGDIIAFCDVDDVWLPDKLELQLATFKDNLEVKMCFSDVIRFSRAGERRFGEYKLRLCRALNKSKQQQFELLLKQNLIVPSTLILKREVFDKIGLFDEELNVCEDWEFVLRAAALGIPMVYLDKITVRYRCHDSNISSQTNAMHNGRISALNKIFQIRSDATDRARARAYAIAHRVSANAFYSECNYKEFHNCVNKIWNLDKKQLTFKTVRRYIKALISGKI